MEHKTISMDDETADLLADHADDNHSELIRELLKEYYTAGVFDTTQAAVALRKRELRDEIERMADRQAQLRDELGRLEDVTADAEGAPDVSEVAAQLDGIPPDQATPENPAIQTQAEKNGLETEVLAAAVAEKAEATLTRQFKSIVTNDDG